MIRRLLVLTLVLAACGGGSLEPSEAISDLTVTDVAGFETHLATLDRPAVVNIWASWCLPCRSEAPLLDEAHSAYGDQIEFIGVAVQDTQAEAKAFLEEYGLAGFEHFFDLDRSIPNHYLGFGTPITFFFSADGELVSTHNGVIDERTLALNIDELLNLEG